MGKDYLHYSADDFIADEYFQRWAKFPDRESDAFWNNWINEHPQQRDDIMKANAFINHLNFREEIPAEDKIEASLNRSLQMIQEKENSWKFRMQKKSVLKKFAWVTAASALVFLAFTIWQTFESSPVSVQVKTGNHEVKKVMLPDSSVVTLNANSSLRYATEMQQKAEREVWLKGEAFFNVKHVEKDDKVKPFIVHSEDLNVEVLGTSFNVKKRNDVYNVTLNTGSIKISLNDDKGSTIYLDPGDFFQYAKKEKSFRKKKVKPELYSDWKEEKMVLDNTTLLELADMIHDTYGYNIIIKDKQLQTEKVSGTLLLYDEKTFLDALSAALSINIIKKDQDLIFQTKTKTK